jgi:hypothetical protein
MAFQTSNVLGFVFCALLTGELVYPPIRSNAINRVPIRASGFLFLLAR